MLNRALGREYAAWDKAASVRFMRPGRSTLYASFDLAEEELTAIRTLLNVEKSVERDYRIEMVDAQGEVHAVIDKVIHIRRRRTTATAGDEQ